MLLYQRKIEDSAAGVSSAPVMSTLRGWFDGVIGKVSLPDLPEVGHLPDALQTEAQGEMLYRWQDQNGQVNFSFEPPSDGTAFEKVAMPEVKNTFAPENMPYPRKVPRKQE